MIGYATREHSSHFGRVVVTISQAIIGLAFIPPSNGSIKSHPGRAGMIVVVVRLSVLGRFGRFGGRLYRSSVLPAQAASTNPRDIRIR
jgi:hypothetical protein